MRKKFCVMRERGSPPPQLTSSLMEWTTVLLEADPFPPLQVLSHVMPPPQGEEERERAEKTVFPVIGFS